MEIKAEFRNGMCRVTMIPSDEWEQKLLGAVAKDGNTLEALVNYEPQGLYSYQKAKMVSITLSPGGTQPVEIPPYDHP